MGAYEFEVKAYGKNAQEAFNSAVSDAQYEFGHGGYSGTIAEKHDFVMIPLPEGKDPDEYVGELFANGDDRIDDKWGPAGCIDLGVRSEEPKLSRYLFFGWASS